MRIKRNNQKNRKNKFIIKLQKCKDFRLEEEEKRRRFKKNKRMKNERKYITNIKEV